MSLGSQVVWLFILAIPIACVSWTVTHEEILREPREFCLRRSREGSSMIVRKFFYMLTCEYCFSHYVTILTLAITGYKLLMTDWRGYLISGFSLVWIANLYMILFGFLRIDLKKEKVRTSIEEKEYAEME